MTVKELLQVWLSAVKYAYKDNTYRGTVVNSNHIIEKFGDIEVEEVSTFDIQSFYNTLMEDGYKAKTVRYIHCTFNAAMKYAQDMQIITHNPCKAVILPKQHLPFEYSVLTSHQLFDLLDYCKIYSERIYLPVLLASCLGLRRGEILGLQYSDINGNVISIRRSVIYHQGERYISTPKTRHSIRHIYVSDEVINAIKEHRYPIGDYISELTQDQLNKRFRVAVSKINLPHLRFHDLRHTYATLLFAHNVPSDMVSERLGHASIDITLDLYTHIDIDMQKPASAVLDYIIKGDFENE